MRLIHFLLQPSVLLSISTRSSRTDAAWDTIFWIPQVLWALLAIGLLIAILISLWRKRVMLLLMWIPYGMVFAAIRVQITAFSLGRGEYGSLSNILDDPLFLETATPSLWAMPCLIFVHTIVVFVLIFLGYRKEYKDN